MLVENTMTLVRGTGKSQIFTAKYARIDINEGSLTIRKTPTISESRMGLMDVEYFIYEGALYVMAKEMNWKYIAWGTALGWGGSRYEISEGKLNTLEVPEECLLRNKRFGLFRRRRKFVIDTNKNPNEYWLKKKEEPTFSFVMHPYKLKE